VTKRRTNIALAVWTVLVLLFLFVPIILICLYAFNPSNVQSWPISGLSTKWFSQTWNNQAMRQSLLLSVKAGLVSTAIALVLGSRCRGSSPGWRSTRSSPGAASTSRC
jgi:putative spermidine/putrescine transport system permease protein